MSANRELLCNMIRIKDIYKKLSELPDSEITVLRKGMSYGVYRQSSRETSDILAQAAETIESLAAKLQEANMERSADCGGWIYCGDGENLPEEPFGCIVTIIDTDPMTMEDFEAILPYQVGYSAGTWNNLDGEQIPFEVIAWMPAPKEPYHKT